MTPICSECKWAVLDKSRIKCRSPRIMKTALELSIHSDGVDVTDAEFKECDDFI